MPAVPKSRRLAAPLSSITDPEEYSIAFFQWSVEDPDAPKHCAQCLLGCASGITLGLKNTPFDGESLSPKLLATQYDFCSSAISFLTKARTTKQLSDLLRSLLSCSCDFSIAKVDMFHHHGGHVHKDHNPFYTGQSHPSSTLVQLLFERLNGVLATSSQSKISKGHNRKRWPRDVSDIIVFSPEILIESIKNWNMILPTPIAIGFLSHAILHCGRILITALLRSADFLKYFASAGHSLCKRIRARQLDVAKEHPLSQVGHFLRAVIATCPSKDMIGTWARVTDQQKDILGALLPMIKILRNPTLCRPSAFGGEFYLKNTIEMYIYFGIFVTNQMQHIPDDLEPDMWVDPWDEGDLDERLEISLDEIKYRMRDTMCYIPGCNKTFQEVGNAFKRCSACHVIGYCSVECQKLDWKDSEFPHKIVCSHIQRFLETGNVDVSKDHGQTADWALLWKNVHRSDLVKDETLVNTLGAWGVRGARRRAREIEL